MRELSPPFSHSCVSVFLTLRVRLESVSSCRSLRGAAWLALKVFSRTLHSVSSDFDLSALIIMLHDGHRGTAAATILHRTEHTT